MIPLSRKLATMSPYGMSDALHILQWWIIQVKSRGPAVTIKVMMVFLFHIYICFYGFTYLFLNSEAKNRFFDITANFEY